MKIVYICHPIAGEVMKKTHKILEIIKEINLTMADVVPFAPYMADVLTMDDDIPLERDRGLQNCIEILKSGIVDELWIYGPRISGGMKAEIGLRYGHPYFYYGS
jgi:hypothetical protein